MNTILITGGTGFIGSHTCVVLLNAGFNLIILDSFINSSEKVIDNICKLANIKDINQTQRLIVYKGDFRNKKILNLIFSEAELKNNNISCVIHFAGLKAVGESNFKPLSYWDVNVSGTINILKVMEQYKCNNFVFSSSAAVYGGLNNNPNEDSITKPENPYGETKLTVEKILRNLYFSSPNKWRIVLLRYFNPIGAHESGLLGEDFNNDANNIFPGICKVALGKKKFFNVFGNDWPTPDGTGVRDYIHVMDLADGHFQAMQYLLRNKPQVVCLNLGTGVGTSVLELIRIFEESNSCKVPYLISNRRIGDVACLIADNKLAISKLNWFPKRDLKKMCQDSWNWNKKNPNGYE